MNFKNKLAVIITTAACAVSCVGYGGVHLIDGSVNAAELSDRTAFQITREMNVGWNLGNTLDATSALDDPTPEQSETAWGQPVTTQAMIDAVKAKGFNTIRIPTTWYQHVDDEFNIDADYLARVKEIVDYCYNDDLYVILNVHHEKWINRSDFDTAYEDMSKKLTKLWSQIAAYFADYDQHLVFEGMNEPRAAGTTREWWGASAADKETINKLDADFVKTVRGVESKYQKTRLLMIPAYCASSDPSIYGSLEVPDDDHVAVSVHAYSPYSFVMQYQDDQGNIVDHSEFNSGLKAELTSILKNVRNKFVTNNIPVVIGEMSSSNYGNTEARLDWAETYAALAKSYAMPIVLWDNNCESNPGDPSEAHGYFNRANLSWYEESGKVADKLISVYNSDSIAFGADAKAPSYTHADIAAGTQLGSDYELDTSVKDGNCTSQFDFDWTMAEGKEFAVTFKGEIPKAAMMDGKWNNWTDLDPYEVKNGVAYYSVDELKAKWAAEDDPSHICFCVYSGTSTVSDVSLIDAPKVTPGGALVIDVNEQPATEPSSEPSSQQPSESETPSTEDTTAATVPPTAEVTLLGDADLDDVVSLSDVTAVSKYLLSNTSFPLANASAMANADVNRDGIIDTMDLSKLIEYNLGKKAL